MSNYRILRAATVNGARTLDLDRQIAHRGPHAAHALLNAGRQSTCHDEDGLTTVLAFYLENV